MVRRVLFGGGALLFVIAGVMLTKVLASHAIGAVMAIIPELVERVMGGAERELAAFARADLRVVRDPSGAITLSGSPIPGGRLTVQSVDEFASVVGKLNGPGTAIVLVGYVTNGVGASALLGAVPPDLSARRAELVTILRARGFHEPQGITLSGPD